MRQLYNVRSFANDLNNYDLNIAYNTIVERILRLHFNTDKVHKIAEDHSCFYSYTLEKLGIDYIIELEKEHELFRKLITVQVKIRDQQYYMRDICVEVMHESTDKPELKSLGYIFEIKADYLLYAWGNNGKLLSPALLINVDRLKQFFHLNKSRYTLVPTKGTISRGMRWITYNMFIPIEDLPAKCYEKIYLQEED